jgi:arabinogalactan endo-1,4-beta-galactosidase
MRREAVRSWRHWPAGCVLAGWMLVCASTAAAAPFMAGADISSLPVHEDHNAIYRSGGVAGDAVEILSDAGTNYFRLRLFVDPQNKNNSNGGSDPFVAQDLDYTIALAQRVKQTGAKLLLDFHYSDTWADPGHQWKPAAWRSLTTIAQLEQQVHDYTKQTIEAFKAAEVLPDMVQIGNEIASGMLWNNEYVATNQLSDATVGGANTGYPWTGGTNNTGFDRLATLLAAGIKGAREGAGPGQEPLVMIHHDQGTRWDRTSYYFDRLLPRLVAKNADIDVIGYSYYPIYHAGGLEAVAENLNNTAEEYGKQVVIAETGFPARNAQSDEQDLEFAVSPAGQQQFLESLVDTVENVPNGLGSGVFWWYADARPTSGLNVWEGGRYGLFDQNGNLQPAANTYNQFLPEFPPGDFNEDGVVDAADYTVWRDGFNTVYDEMDYFVWRSNFGEGLAGAGATAPHSVPEPASMVMLVVAMVSCSLRRRR